LKCLAKEERKGGRGGGPNKKNSLFDFDDGAEFQSLRENHIRVTNLGFCEHVFVALHALAGRQT